MANLTTTWRGIVRNQMRSLPILDLYDYYDFSFNIKERASEIRNLLLKAKYKASSPLIVKLEKRYGICRHVMVPSPSDALIFQTITEELAPSIIRRQPTSKAFYSRDKQTLKLPHQVAQSRYPWFILWPKYQKNILKFTNNCDYLVVTDVSDYYDNIGLRELRHIVSSYSKTQEVILDLLFNIIEQLAWNPDYLPTSLKGLPQIDIEAFRLLPHAMLFETDKLLNKQTNGNFVRWMDDINFGVDTKDEAFTILGNLNDALKTRGLALNISKTEIYTASEAKEHFLFDENKYLDQVLATSTAATNFQQVKSDFLKRFRAHLGKSKLMNWDKVTKRYFTVAAHFKFTELRPYVYDLFVQAPSTRSHILSYLGHLKFSKNTAAILLSLINSVKRYDDVTLFELCKLITEIQIPHTPTGIEFVKNVNKVLKEYATDFDLFCYFWFLAKYGAPYIIMNLIQKTKERWRNEPFLAREVMSILPRLLRFNQPATLRLLDEQARIGTINASSVANSLNSIIKIERLSGHTKYIFPPKPQKPFPLPKYLILTAFLSSRNLMPSEKTSLVNKVNTHVSDQWYLYWLKNIPFYESEV